MPDVKEVIGTRCVADANHGRDFVSSYLYGRVTTCFLTRFDGLCFFLGKSGIAMEARIKDAGLLY